MSYSVWSIPTKAGREQFRWSNSMIGNRWTDMLSADEAAFFHDMGETAPDKNNYRRIVVLPEPGLWQHPLGHLFEVTGYEDNDNGIPSVLGHAQGGGLAEAYLPAFFLREFKPAKLTWRQVQVTGDWCDPDESFAAWWDGRRWNGWVVPYFTSEEAGRMASRASGLNLRHRVVNGVPTWMAAQNDDEDYDHFPMTWVDLGSGIETPLYPIGAGCWCWELAEETETA